MTEEEEARAIAAQQREIADLRTKLEDLCKAEGYTLAQLCRDLKPEAYSLDARSQQTWNGLGSPPPWFLREAKLTPESYWKLSPHERKKRRDGCLQLLK